MPNTSFFCYCFQLTSFINSWHSMFQTLCPFQFPKLIQRIYRSLRPHVTLRLIIMVKTCWPLIQSPSRRDTHQLPITAYSIYLHYPPCVEAVSTRNMGMNHTVTRIPLNMAWLGITKSLSHRSSSSKPYLNLTMRYKTRICNIYAEISKKLIIPHHCIFFLYTQSPAHLMFSWHF